MNPIKKAESIMSLLDINSPDDIDIELIANFFDISVKRKKLDGSSARLLCVKGSASITISNSEQYTPRIRFSIAHELGHYFLHRGAKNIFSCSESNMHDWNNNNIEAEANLFAANILMPYHIFKESIKLKDYNIKLVANLSNEFSTSISATLIRIIDCSREPCALVCSKNKKIAWIKKNKDFIYITKRNNENIAEHSFAFDCFKSMSGPFEGMVPAYAWIDDYRTEDEAMIFESSFCISSQSTVLSLLWIDKDIEKSR